MIQVACMWRAALTLLSALLMMLRRMQSISSTVQSCVAGHDSTIMTYGQTGSGKTHTVLGDMLPGGDGEGIVGRAVQTLFQVSATPVAGM